MRDASEIERAVAAFVRSPNGGLIVTESGLAYVHHDLIVTLAAQHKLPAVYNERSFVRSNHALMRPASEKRQGTKSRSVVHRRCGGLYGDLAAV